MKRPRGVLTCPNCGSSDLYYEAGMITGQLYHCKRCDYIGPFVIERDVEQPEPKRRGRVD